MQHLFGRTKRTSKRQLLGTGIPLLTFLVAASGLAVSCPAAAPPRAVVVSAAISLKDALDELGRTFEQRHPGTKITFNYAGSGTLQHQIEQGAPVDIFFSAAEKQMDALESQGLIAAGTRRTVVANELVLIVPAGSGAVRSFQDLARPEVKIIAVGEASTVPAGMYARQTLEHLGLAAVTEKKSVYAKDVRQVLTYVETGNADAGIVYQTDARISSKVRVVASAPVASHEPILYPAAIVKNAKEPAAAREFLEFLGGAEASAVFAKYGFAAPEKRAETN
jgi:molybdate transport system substrate-binding protein